ncbi:hypothetical protein [Pararhodospirillum photometricum]|uniref:Uncharacterized protein n=1 Tax=Pararhodospirillum photometricum DSM 122 TaxID=1150469 RepID=H6SM75_PARPM|nr:hypothetical protein [Pararhodospirillum photometricum]CCG09090.1 unnamed protein product [Pararhodospirillum photometricum DSM 122]
MRREIELMKASASSALEEFVSVLRNCTGRAAWAKFKYDDDEFDDFLAELFNPDQKRG